MRRKNKCRRRIKTQAAAAFVVRPGKEQITNAAAAAVTVRILVKLLLVMVMETC